MVGENFASAFISPKRSPYFLNRFPTPFQRRNFQHNIFVQACPAAPLDLESSARESANFRDQSVASRGRGSPDQSVASRGRGCPSAILDSRKFLSLRVARLPTTRG